MKFDFGTWSLVNGQQEWDELIYNPCGCEEVYSFRDNSAFLQYMRQQCSGWQDSIDNKYTLKYLILIILTQCRDKRILYKNGPIFMIRRDTDEGKVFSAALDSSIKTNLFYLSQVRPLLERKHLKNSIALGIPCQYKPDFICSEDVDYLLANLLRPMYDRYDLYVQYSCSSRNRHRSLLSVSYDEF